MRSDVFVKVKVSSVCLLIGFVVANEKIGFFWFVK